jgi:tetratricopeptide (TPR) repeat protein
MAKDILSDQINSLFAKEKWAEARALLEPELIKFPGSHWLLDRLSVTYYEQKNYQKAFTFINKAFAIAPRCPLVLWDYAGTCAAQGKTQASIQKYKALFDMFPDEFHEDECGEDMHWASSLIMDCFFRLAVCYQTLKKYHDAMSYLDEYIGIRTTRDDLDSLYSIADAKKLKARISYSQRTNGRIPGIATIGVVTTCYSVKRAHNILAGCR